jgi:hypothetical protein
VDWQHAKKLLLQETVVTVKLQDIVRVRVLHTCEEEHKSELYLLLDV